MKSAKINVMLGLLAVLFISLGYLTMQKKEGFREGALINFGDTKTTNVSGKKKKKKENGEDDEEDE
jgi:hypothetical protein